MLIICCGCEKQDTTEQNETQPVIANEPEIIEPEEKEPEPIELTMKNIFDYLTIKETYEIEDSHMKMTIDITPLKEGRFENAKIILWKSVVNFDGDSVEDYQMPWVWKVSSSDPSYKYCEAMYEAHKDDWVTENNKDKYLITVISIPSNGYYTETHSFVENVINLGTPRIDAPDTMYETYDSMQDSSIFSGKILSHRGSSLLPEGTPFVSGTFIPAE